MTVGTGWSSGGVQLPQRIEDALLSDSLVFFCGAGVSSAAPSELPGFRGLAETVAQGMGYPELVPADRSVPVQFDVVMGKLDEISGDIHRRVSSRIRQAVTPNAYHTEIWRIASAQHKTPRIVTTNFDLLFEAAASDLGFSNAVHTAPALPLGHDFSGLVHLHGVQDPLPTSRMVLTDKDFGRAYITEGWATQFLTQMFSKYTVLLVGYSAEDTIVQYLNRALPNNDARFAFTKDSGDLEVWARLGITPIPFPSTPGNEYGSLEVFVSNWSSRVNANSKQRFDEVRAFVDLGPESAHENPGNTAWLLSDPELARHFRSYALAADWLLPLDSMDILEVLFSPDAETSTDSADWSEWVQRSIEVDDGEKLLHVLARHQGKLHPSLWFTIWQKIYSGFRPTRSHRQLAFILAATDRNRDDRRLSMLISRVVDTDPETAEQLLLHLLTPRLSLKVRSAWGLGNDSLETRLSLAWRTSSIRDAWPKLMPHLADRVHLLSVVLDLIRTGETTDSFFNGDDDRDSISRHRNQVEHAETYMRDDPYILVVDIARDLLRESVRNHGTRDAIRHLEDRSEMIRRLGLDALAEARSAEADNLLKLLERSHLSFEFRSRPEAFRLMAVAYKNSADTARREFEDYIQTAKQTAGDLEISDRDKYNIFVWLTEEAAAGELAWNIRRAYEQAGHEPDESPNLTSVVRITANQDLPQEAMGRFRTLDIKEVVRQLRHDRTLSDEYSNGQILRELQDYLEQTSGEHLRLLDEMTSQEFWTPAPWRIVIQNLVRSPTWKSSDIVERLKVNQANMLEIIGHLAFSVAYPSQEMSPPLDNEMERVRLLLGLWEVAQPEISTEAPTDPEHARSTARGSLAHYYTETLLRVTEQQGTEARLATEGTDGLLELLTAQDAQLTDPSPMMVAEFAAHIRYRAPEWFERHLQPRLEAMDKTPQTASLWAGLLSRGLRSKQLRERLREPIRTGWPLISTALPSSTESFIHAHAACFAFDSGPTDQEWPDAFLIHANDTDREKWIRSVAYCLDGEPVTYQDVLFAHWSHRLDGQPEISGGEQRALLRWLTLPGLDIKHATDLFVRGPAVAVRDEDRFDYYDVESFPHEEYARDYLRIANHLMQGSGFPPPFVDELIVATIKITPTDAKLVKETLSLLLGLGYAPASLHLQTLDA